MSLLPKPSARGELAKMWNVREQDFLAIALCHFHFPRCLICKVVASLVSILPPPWQRLLDQRSLKFIHS